MSLDKMIYGELFRAFKRLVIQQAVEANVRGGSGGGSESVAHPSVISNKDTWFNKRLATVREKEKEITDNGNRND